MTKTKPMNVTESFTNTVASLYKQGIQVEADNCLALAVGQINGTLTLEQTQCLTGLINEISPAMTSVLIAHTIDRNKEGLSQSYNHCPNVASKLKRGAIV